MKLKTFSLEMKLKTFSLGMKLKTSLLEMIKLTISMLEMKAEKKNITRKRKIACSCKKLMLSPKNII